MGIKYNEIYLYSWFIFDLTHAYGIYVAVKHSTHIIQKRTYIMEQ